MYRRTYKIKKKLLIALAADIILLLVLLSLSLFFKSQTSERIVVVLITIAALLVFFEAASRKILEGDHGILLRKFFREREILWQDITQVGIVVLRKKVYLLLTTIKGFYIVSNSYENFQLLLRDLAGHVEREKMDDDVLKQIEHPINTASDIAKMWFGAAVLVAIIVLKIISS